MVQKICSEETFEFREFTLRRKQTVRSEDLSGELQGESEEPRPTESKDDAAARRVFWSFQGEFIFRHHDEPGVQLHVPREETFRTPLRYIDVMRSTHTVLDVVHEYRIYDYWNVDAKRNLLDSWKGLTKFTLLEGKPPKVYLWSGRTDKCSSDHQTR